MAPSEFQTWSLDSRHALYPGMTRVHTRGIVVLPRADPFPLCWPIDRLRQGAACHVKATLHPDKLFNDALASNTSNVIPFARE